MRNRARYGFDITAVIPEGIQPAGLFCNDIEYLPVVRCKDCKYWNDEGLCKKHSSPIVGAIYGTDVNDYCSEGKRKEQDDE